MEEIGNICIKKVFTREKCEIDDLNAQFNFMVKWYNEVIR